MCFQMAESFENLNDILRDWAKRKNYKKYLAESFNTYEEKEEEKQSRFFY